MAETAKKRARTEAAPLPAGKPKVFNDAVLGHVELHPCCVAIVDSPEFQRLRGLKQLGPTEYVYPAAGHTRFAHSLGVSFLAGKLVEKLAAQTSPPLHITPREILCVKLAGLCHDLGHGPLSHTFEKFVRMQRPSIRWHHEHASAALFKKVVTDHKLLQGVFGTYALDESDVHFVQELIFGDESDAPETWAWKGLPATKRFLFEIVSNHRNGIDVDKFDYFRRDAFHLNIPVSFDSDRLIMAARAIPDDTGVFTVAYPEKEVWNVYELFRTRFNLHKRAYQHRVVHAVERMLCDVLMEAEAGGFTLHGIKLSKAMENLETYATLTDAVFDVIAFLATTDLKLKPAALLLERIRTRQLHRHVGEVVVPPLKRDDVCARNEEDLLREIARHAPDPAGRQALLAGAYAHRFDITFGMGDRNPVERVFFYLRGDDAVGRILNASQVSTFVPRHFAESYVRLFVRDRDDAGLYDAALSALQAWERAVLGRTESAIAPSPTRGVPKAKRPPRPPPHARPVGYRGDGLQGERAPGPPRTP